MNTLLRLSRLLLTLPLAGAPLAGLTASNPPENKAHASMAAVFVTPPDSIQTSIYWYWLSGNISREGVIKDLEAMKRAGINRAFIGNIGLGPMETPYRPVKLFSDEWWEVTHAALKRASELGIEIGMFNCPGWSQAGGPWIEPRQAMRYLTSVQAEVEGGQTVDIRLAKPADDFQDVRVIAFPQPAAARLTNADTRVTVSSGADRPQQLLDGDLSTSMRFDGSAEVTLDFAARDQLDLRSITVWPAYHPIRASVEVQVQDRAGQYHTVSSFDIDRTNPNIEVGFDPYAPVSISVAKSTGRNFRMIVRGAGAGSGFSEVALSSMPRVERYPEKILAKMFQTPLPYWNEYQWRDQPALDDPTLAVDPRTVIDVSQYLDGDRFVWNAPAGHWIVQRLGMRPTGIVNSPADPEGTGLEVDKMTPAYLQHHFDAFIGAILRRIPAEDRTTFRVIVADSYEKGGQNFTDTFLEEFRQRYGYDPLPYLPVYGGTVVGSPDLSDRFLWDMRRMVADKLAYAHIGGLREIAHRNGLRLWLENYGHWGFSGEFLQYGGQSDEVSGEFWGEGSLGDIENRAASSCAHIYGKNRVSAESYTSAGNDFGRYPAQMKARGDRFFCEGINNTLLHLYIAQPGDEPPGMNAPFGTEFNRNNTWFSQFDLFTSYLKRVNFMLQQGLNVADVAYFIGEDTPKMTGITDPALPKGYQFDYINGEVLLNRITIRDGLWTLPHGTQYRILVLPKLATMRPELLARLQTLVREGGILLGPAPQRSPSLENYPEADREVRERAAELWNGIDGRTVKAARYGKGAVLCGMDMQQALEYARCLPDCEVGAETPVHFGHRDAGQQQIYFLSNQSPERITFTGKFRVTGASPEAWDPVTGEIRPLPEFSDDGQRIAVPMVLEPSQSLFIVFTPAGTRSTKRSETVNFPTYVPVRTLDGPWTVTFQKGRRGPAAPVVTEQLRDLRLSGNDSIRYFSGEITYETTVDLSRKELKQGLSLHTGEVGVMAKVYVNDTYAGGIWTAPHRIDLTKLLVPGRNRIKIVVVNTWVNRLIGDSRLPAAERGTWTWNNPWRPDSPLQPAGLFHPVTLQRTAQPDER